MENIDLPISEGVFVLSKDVNVLKESDKTPILTTHEFGKGRGIYMSGYRFNLLNTRLLMNAICYAGRNEERVKNYICSNPLTECAYYPQGDKLVIINNSEKPQSTSVRMANGKEITVELEAFDIEIIS